MLPGPSIPRKVPSQGVKGLSPESPSKLGNISKNQWVPSVLRLTQNDMLAMLRLIKKEVLVNESRFFADASQPIHSRYQLCLLVS
jgi:hypothetical protein